MATAKELLKWLEDRAVSADCKAQIWRGIARDSSVGAYGIADAVYYEGQARRFRQVAVLLRDLPEPQE